MGFRSYSRDRVELEARSAVAAWMADLGKGTVSGRLSTIEHILFILKPMIARVEEDLREIERLLERG